MCVWLKVYFHRTERFVYCRNSFTTFAPPSSLSASQQHPVPSKPQYPCLLKTPARPDFTLPTLMTHPRKQISARRDEKNTFKHSPFLIFVTGFFYCCCCLNVYKILAVVLITGLTHTHTGGRDTVWQKTCVSKEYSYDCLILRFPEGGVQLQFFHLLSVSVAVTSNCLCMSTISY